MTGLGAQDPVDSELRRMLREFEGPEMPVRRPRGRRPQRRLLMTAGLAVGLLVVSVVGYLLANENRPRKASLQSLASCQTLELDRRRYIVRRAPTGGLTLGSSAGTGLLRCRDAVSSTETHALRGVDPEIAVVLAGAGGPLYTAEGVCPRRQNSALLACLRIPYSP